MGLLHFLAASDIQSRYRAGFGLRVRSWEEGAVLCVDQGLVLIGGRAS
jgi:hypothetical protein